MGTRFISKLIELFEVLDIVSVTKYISVQS